MAAQMLCIWQCAGLQEARKLPGVGADIVQNTVINDTCILLLVVLMLRPMRMRMLVLLATAADADDGADEDDQ